VKRVLVVDDEPKIASFVSRALAAEGFLVDAAGDGERALELLRTGRYGVVVLDLLLPDVDGVEVLQRTIEESPDQQVIVLSALPDVETKVRCFDLGAADYVTKPFSLMELIARVRRRLRQCVVADEQYLRAGPVTLDLQRRTVDTGSGPVPLSGREFLLLQHLVRRCDEVCTREQLLADIWGYAFDPGTNVVDVCIGRLRAKLGADVVDTVRSLGYRFRAA
jgi:two-component system OmpR family response regulator